ncbi:sialic acid-binding Ig-like lectin 10 [Lissotriton helveticus]
MKLGSVLLLSLLWKGVLGAFEDYTLTVNPVTVQEGLCVFIPCQFTIAPTQEAAESPHGYWFIQGENMNNPAVASNDESKAIYAEARGRFRLVGDVTRWDCSLGIDDVRKWDEKTYYFRYEHSQNTKIKFNYLEFPLPISVVGLQDKPTIYLPPALIEGTNVSINCTAPGRCSGTPPNITWSGDWNFAYSIMNRSVSYANGTQTHISEITFQATRKDNRKQLICTANFYTAKASTRSNVTLNVEYPPVTPTINVFITERERSMRTTNATHVEVLEGSDCNLLCTADSNPLSNLTWKKGELILNESKLLSNDLKLTRLNITSNDNGVYSCTAANKLGREQSSVTVDVQYPPRNLKITTEDTLTQGQLIERENNSTEKILEGRSITMKCSVESSPLASLTWMKVGNKSLIESNGLSQNSLTLSLPHVTPETDGQYLCVAENQHGVVNSSLFITVEYKPSLAAMYNSSCQSEANMIRCMCVVEASPLPDIEWKINESTLPESFQNGSILLAFSQYRATKNATLVMNISDSVRLSVSCIFSNKYGRGAQILLSPAEDPQAPSIMPMIGGGLAGIFAVAGISLLGWLFLRRVRRTKNSNNGMGDKEEMVDDDTLIYSEILKAPKSTIAAAVADHGTDNKSGSDITSTERKEDLYENSGEDNLQYASIDFSKLQPRSKATTPPEETLYSEVKLH